MLYHLAFGGKPEDFHPAVQSLADGLSIAFQPQPPMGPGLLGSLDEIRAAIGSGPAESDHTSGGPEAGGHSADDPPSGTLNTAPAISTPLTLHTKLPDLSNTPSGLASGANAPDGTVGDQRAAFIKSAIPAAVASEKASGAPASVTLAQAALESSNGTKHMGAANNYFGIKAQTQKDGSIAVGPIASDYTMQPTKEFDNGAYVAKTVPFRSYNSMADSFTDHGLFLSKQPRYGAALRAYQSSRDASAFARSLQSAGYATDPHYADKLIGIMNKYNLTRYDQ